LFGNLLLLLLLNAQLLFLLDLELTLAALLCFFEELLLSLTLQALALRGAGLRHGDSAVLFLLALFDPLRLSPHAFLFLALQALFTLNALLLDTGKTLLFLPLQLLELALATFLLLLPSALFFFALLPLFFLLSSALFLSLSLALFFLSPSPLLLFALLALFLLSANKKLRNDTS